MRERWGTIRVMPILTLLLSLGCAPPVPQSAACVAYVGCVEAIDLARGGTTNLARFEAGGDCWGSPLAGELCDRACTSGLEFLQERQPALPEECAP